MYLGSPGIGRTPAHLPPCAAQGVKHDPGVEMITLIKLSTIFFYLSFAKLVTVSGVFIIIWTAKISNWQNQSSIDKTFVFTFMDWQMKKPAQYTKNLCIRVFFLLNVFPTFKVVFDFKYKIYKCRSLEENLRKQ